MEPSLENTFSDPKQVLIVRKDLKMPKGKIASQAAHGAVCALTEGRGASIREVEGRRELVIPLDEDACAWLSGEYKKITLAVNSEDELLALHQAALAAGLRAALIQDNGHTVFNGVKTYTALALGPHASALLDPLTSHLPLL